MAVRLPASVPSDLCALDLALFWADLGFRVLPVRPQSPPGQKDNKAAWLPEWQRVATADPDTIRSWNQWGRGARVGLATGTDTVDVYDEDVADGKPGATTSVLLVAAGLLDAANCAVVSTPSGGRHFWGAGSNQHNAGWSEKFGADFRGTGGMVLAPGNPGYRWERGPAGPLASIGWDAIRLYLDPPIPAFPVPEAIQKPGGLLVAPLAWNDLPYEPKPGEDTTTPKQWFNANNRVEDMLLELGWEYAGEQGRNRHYTRPGKRTNEGVSASVFVGDNGTEMMNVFSTSTEFETGKGYDAFEIYAQVRHGGNKREAASAVRRTLMPPPAVSSAPLAAPPATSQPVAGMTTPLGLPVPTAVLSGAEPSFASSVLDLDGFFDLPEPEWLIRDLLDSGINWLTAEANMGKSFVALEIAIHLALGRDYYGRRIEREHTVLYVASEDSKGISIRLKAWLKAKGEVGDREKLAQNMRFSAEAPQVGDPQQTAELIQVACQYDLTIIDTQVDVTVGLEENSAKDAGIMLQVLRAIDRASKSVLMVHHPALGEGQWRPRGSGAQVGKANTVLHISKPDAEKHPLLIRLTTPKQKHAFKGDSIGFWLPNKGAPAVLTPTNTEVEDSDGKQVAKRKRQAESAGDRHIKIERIIAWTLHHWPDLQDESGVEVGNPRVVARKQDIIKDLAVTVSDKDIRDALATAKDRRDREVPLLEAATHTPQKGTWLISGEEL